MNILKTEKISKHYNNRRTVNEVSIEIHGGEIVGLLGPNGAGKTTSFYIILGLIFANSGKIKLNDVDISSFPVHQRAKLGIGYLPQEASIFRKLSARDNIYSILELRKELTNQQKKDELETLIYEFNLEKVRDTMGISLSGGERRRVEIARTLAIKPKFILLDEPFAGIDPISILEIKKIIKELQSKGIGVLITDHNVRDTLDICNKAYILNEGKVMAEGSAETILNDSDVRKIYLGEDFNLEKRA